MSRLYLWAAQPNGFGLPGWIAWRSQPGPADHYFDISIIKNPPKWADEDRFVKKIGRIRFYDLDRDIEKQL
jgi:hypothetical protein